MLLTDTKHTVDIVAVDPTGKPTGSGAVDLALYEVDWRWWWEKGSETFASYAGNASHTAVAEGRVELKDGKATWSFQVDYPEWGRYLLVATDVDGTHRAGKTMYIDWPGWAGRAQSDNPGGASVLSVTVEDDIVEVGDEISLNVPTGGEGRVLVSLETGTGVLDAFWVEPEGETTNVRIPVTADMAPSVYANVTYVQPHGAAGNDLPMRLYGVVPVEVVDPATKLAPAISVADTFEPDSEVTIGVSENAGKAMTYTLAVVDQGLLGLTAFQTPDPWDTFYAREALGVRTWDTWSHLAGASGGALEGLIAVGGGGDMAEGGGKQPNRFAPVVEVLGPFHLEAGETASHTVPIGTYVGEVRVMVVGGHQGAYGSAHVQVPVRKPLMVLATVPRVLGPQERMHLPVDLFAMEDGIGATKVTVKTSGPIEVLGEATRSLSLQKVANVLESFELKVGDGLGEAVIEVTAEAAGHTAKTVVPVTIRHPGSVQTRTAGGRIEAGDTWTAALEPVGMPGTNDAVLEVSRLPPMDLGRRSEQLIRYPHGCLEQTTSAAFPQLYLPELMTLSDAKRDAVRKHLRSGIDRLRSMQRSSGGFGYWPGASEAHPWATSYALHFLLEAERAGHLLPPSLKDQALRYQREQAGRWVREGERDDLVQAYRLFTLALAGRPELGAMNRLREARLSDVAELRLAAAYAVAGQPEAGRALLARADTKVVNYQELSHTFGSATRDRAMMLEALVHLDDRDKAGALAEELSRALTSTESLSTHATAYALVAMARYAGIGGDAELSLSWSVDGAATPATASTPLLSVPLGDRQGALSVENTGNGPLFLRLVRSGLPAVGEEDAGSNGLRVSVDYEDAQTGWEMGPEDVAQGTDMVVYVTVENTAGRRLDELALTHILPSGWEVHATASGTGDGYDWREVRDDRVHTYFDLDPGQRKRFRIGAHASFLGRYYLPPVQVEAMYNATIQAQTRGAWVDVTVEGTQG
jgi:uncharacterized protein YfaS (alpha-2-macroglobulin family)